MKTEKLKPCPFCGGNPSKTAEMVIINYKKVYRHEIFCAYCYVSSVISYDENEAISKWNTRHDEMTLKKVLLLIPELAIKIMALAILACGLFSFLDWLWRRN